MKANASKELMVQVALGACVAHEKGRTEIVIDDTKFDLDTGAYCSRFVRQCYETVTGQGAWTCPWAGKYAIWTERNLVQAGFVTKDPVPGDIVCFNDSLYRRYATEPWGWTVQQVEEHNAYGHIAILLPGGMIAENTSSPSRGPGTVRSQLTAALRERISGYYSVLPSQPGYAAGPIKTVVMRRNPDAPDGFDYVPVAGQMLAGKALVEVREYNRVLGFPDENTIDHIPGSRKVYVILPERIEYQP